MPTTRSQRGNSEESTPVETTSEETTSEESSATTLTIAEDRVPTPKAIVNKNVSSPATLKNKEKALRIARAKEDLLNLQIKFAAARLERIELEQEHGVQGDGEERIVEWLEEARQTEDPKPPVLEQTPIEEQPRVKTDIERLAAAIAIAARSGPQQTRPIELPQFGGSHHDWLCFEAAYRESESSFSEIENLARLRRALIGRAKESVENLLMYNAKTEEIMKSLKIRFGRPDTIALAEIDRLRSLPRITDSPKEICVFASRVANAVATLKALKRKHYMYNPEAVKTTIEKLTPALRYRWFDYAAAIEDDEPSLEKLAAFLNRESERCSRYAQPEAAHEVSSPVNRKQKAYNTAENIVNRNNRCIVCTEEHDIENCRSFTQAPVANRWDIAKEKKLCFSCLHYRTKNHHCRRQRCNIDLCPHWHHRLLHNKKEEKKQENETVTSMWTSSEFTSFLKIVPVSISGPAGAVHTHALLDDGSTVTLIDEEIANRTGASGPTEALHIEAIGEHSVTSTSRRVKLKISGTSNRKFEIRARTIPNLKLSAQAIREKDIEDCNHLIDIKKHLQYSGVKPRMLIGQDNWQLLTASAIRKGKRHQPVASRTPLGWVLHGTRSRHTGRYTVNFINDRDEDMNEQLREYFALESLMIQPKQPVSDTHARAISILDTGVIEKDGRYEVPLLWKQEDSTLPDNYDSTLKRLQNIERKLDHDPQLKIEYSKQMEALIEKGYAERAPPEKSSRTWYLPHFAVTNPMKPGKIRIVHDAAAKTKGVSLNDHLMTGPDLIQSLPGVLMRFRQRKIAVTADIKEMFMQVKIRAEDRDALRYLWRGDRRDDAPPEEYRMTSLIFGATCSPAIAIYIKNRNAAKYQDIDTAAYNVIVRNHYVDDLLNSYDTEIEAINSSRRVAQIQLEANYELRQWTSNSDAVMNAIAPGTSRPAISLDGSAKIERTLGVIWDPSTDEIGFNLSMTRLPPEAIDNRTPTKRETLRILMSLFDPLGLASPVTVQAKLILQEVWRRGTAWDEKIDNDLATKWRQWIEHLKALRDVRIPRCYLHYSQAASLQLHMFVDASETAYSAVAYWRATNIEGATYVSLITAKTKVSPLKLTSIPRLELQAAVLGSRMSRTILEEHDVKPESTTYWTDSRTVLTWLKTGSRSYRPFVAHRIAAIEENTTLADWRWVPTKLNVADDATRNVPPDFNTKHRWFTGPQFLREDPSAWPSERPTLEEPTGEERVHHARTTHTSLIEATPDPERFSKWERLLRSTARVLQFIDICRPKQKTHYNYRRNRKNKLQDADWNRKNVKIASVAPPSAVKLKQEKYIAITDEQLRRAELQLVRVSQHDSFAAEMENRKKGKLRNLSIEIDSDVIRIKSRISAAANLSAAQQNPIVLCGDNHIARLYIEYVHRRLHHAGAEATINECRSKYWITRLRPVARMIIHRCIGCRIRRSTPPEPPTGDLPPCRLAHHRRPFSYTGLDYFGPLTVTVGRAIQKRYVALFTCLTTRAVHLEVVPSLSTESAIMALRRYIARRGCPTEIWSDNGTNLRGADKELRRAIDDAVQQEASLRAIGWRFIPPGAPFMGGAWERLVRSVKTALYAVLHERHPTEEVLHTMLAEVEFTVNNRPLTHVSVDPEDPEALTPNHFLLMGPAMNPAPGTFTDRDLLTRGHWRTSQRLADMFWQRWLREYLPDLQNRREPHGRGPQLKIGDVVLLIDNTLPRNMWPLGRVTKTYPGKDGVVRVADIRTRGGELRRPVKKMILLIEDRPSSSNR